VLSSARYHLLQLASLKFAVWMSIFIFGRLNGYFIEKLEKIIKSLKRGREEHLIPLLVR